MLAGNAVPEDATVAQANAAGGKKHSIKVVPLTLEFAKEFAALPGLEDIPGLGKAPWTFEEAHERFAASATGRGHFQVFCKCLHCTLEFAFFTLRTEVELLEAYQPSAGERGGFCRSLHCPECGDRRLIMLGYARCPGAICEHVSASLREYTDGLLDKADRNRR